MSASELSPGLSREQALDLRDALELQRYRLTVGWSFSGDGMKRVVRPNKLVEVIERLTDPVLGERGEADSVPVNPTPDGDQPERTEG